MKKARSFRFGLFTFLFDSVCDKRQQRDLTRALDGHGELTLMHGAGAGHAAGQDLSALGNISAKLGGVFVTMADKTKFRDDIVKVVQEEYGKAIPVLKAVIPSTVRLSEVSGTNRSIFLHAPKHKAADAYADLVKEVVRIGAES